MEAGKNYVKHNPCNSKTTVGKGDIIKSNLNISISGERLAFFKSFVKLPVSNLKLTQSPVLVLYNI